MTRDSDSDSESESDSASTQYILGFDDGSINDPSDLAQFTISRIGGTPVLLPFQRTTIPQSDLNCLSCQKPLPLLIQIYCPSLQNPCHDRVLYLFGCPQETCQTQSQSKSVRGFKAWKFNKEYQKQSSKLDNQPQTELGENPFKINNASKLFEQCFENPFSTEHNPFAVEPVENTIPQSKLTLDDSFSKLALTPTGSIEKINSSLMASLPTLCSPPHYITTDYEVKPKPVTSFDPTVHEFEEETVSMSCKKTNKQALAEKDIKKGSCHTSSHLKPSKNQQQEAYEVQVVKGVDAAFLDFQDRINWNNQSSQIVRYNPNGRPLLVNSEQANCIQASIPRLKCQHKSKFELQLMPASSSFFSNLINWTTVWINDCCCDCPATDEGWLELQCFVQFIE